MEKIAAFIDKLQELKNNNGDLNEIAYYTQMLYAELMYAKDNQKNEEAGTRKKVSVIMPGRSAGFTTNHYEDEGGKAASVKKEQESLFVSTDAMEEFSSEKKSQFQPQPNQQPYPSHHPVTSDNSPKELNEVIADNKPSLNDRLKREHIELAAKLTESVSVKDLAKAIDINDKFLFINELFRGDRNMYERSIKTINECNNLEDAQYWMERELKIKLGWQEGNAPVQRFYQLVKKRFS